MVSEAKSAIFDSIRRNLAESLPFDAVHNEHIAHQQQDEFLQVISVEAEAASLAEIFCENLRAIGGNSEIVEDRAQAISFIQEIIKQKNAQKIAVSDAEIILEIQSLLKTDAEFLKNASKGNLFECDLGITSAQFGIAETGTLVIESDKEFNRLTSLIPPVHICVLEAKQICKTLGETLGFLEKDLSRTVTFITGPSRTSDIELTLAIGVHGPGELFVILIEEKN